jgi:hypothetical protein
VPYSGSAMKQSIKAVVDGLLILAIGVLAFQWLTTPHLIEKNFTVEKPEPLEASGTEMLAGGERVTAVQPQQIARLFGWRKRVSVAKSEPAAPDSATTITEEMQPEVISYLRYIGYAAGSPGECTYFVKDTDTGRIVPLRTTGAHDGWALIDVSEAGILVERDDTLYHIPFESKR